MFRKLLGLAGKTKRKIPMVNFFYPQKFATQVGAPREATEYRFWIE
jgi:hypothetical protein